MSIVTHLGENLNWTAYKNGHNQYTITFTSSGSAYSLSGYVFTLNVTKMGGTTNELQLTEGSGITNGGATGVLTIDLTQTQASTTLPGNDYWYEIVYTVNAKVYALLQGSLTLANKTNPESTSTSVSVAVNLAGSPVSAAITLAGVTSASIASALGAQAANRVYAGPSSGSAATPTFRALVAADIPAGVGGGAWGSITGTLSSQTDLQTALDAKAAATDVLYLSNITGYVGATGSDASITAATAVDRIPTTALSVGKRISAIVTIAGTQRRLYTAELVTPVDATANIELSPSVIRPNDFNASTNNKVWREIKNSGIIDVSNYGVVPDPTVFVSDQINAIITAAATGDTLIFPPGTYKIFAITVSKKLNFIGFGATFSLSTVSSPHFTISQDLVTVKGINFVGQGRSNATYPLQSAISIANCSNVLISDCTFDAMPNYCIRTNSTHISDTSADFGGINIVNCQMMRAKYGLYADTRGEYVQLVGCTITDCDTGAYIGAGNVNFTGSQILDCSTAGVNIVAGTNDAHGLFSGCQINHNAKSIVASGITNGHFFRGCNIYFGDMEFTSCAGLVFTDCVLEAMEMKFDGCTGCRIEGCTVPGLGGAIILTKSWNGNASSVVAKNNLNLSNSFSAGWNDHARVTTTNATVTTLLSYAIPTSNTVLLKGFVVARRTGGTSGTAEDGAAYEFKAVYKNVAGTATLIGSSTITAIGESQAGWDVTLPVSSGNVNISVTGAADNNITWYLGGFEALHVSS